LQAYFDIWLEFEALLNLYPSVSSFTSHSPVIFHIFTEHDGNNKPELLYYDDTWETWRADFAHQC